MAFTEGKKKFYGKLETFNEVLFITLEALTDVSPSQICVNTWIKEKNSPPIESSNFGPLTVLIFNQMCDIRYLFDVVETLPSSSREQYLHAKGTL